jgi:Tfp pilus assembly protein PilF
MQQQANTLSSLKKMSWLELLEVATLIGVLGCGVTAVATKKASVAIAPIPAALVLNWVNRSRSSSKNNAQIQNNLNQLGYYAKTNFDILAGKMQNLEQVTIPALGQTGQKLESSLDELSGQFQHLSAQLADMQQLSMDERMERSQMVMQLQQQISSVSELREQLEKLQEFTTTEVEDQIRQRKEMLVGLQQQLDQLSTANKDQKQTQQATLTKINNELEKLEKTVAGALHKQQEEQDQRLLELGQQLTYAQDLINSLQQKQDLMEANASNLAHQQKQIVEVVNCLRDLETASTQIEINMDIDRSFYQRALNHEKLGDETAAMADYGKAIEANPKHAEAYFHRALLLEKRGDKQIAVDDFRKAAQYFLEQGDVASYQSAKAKTKATLDLQIGGEQDDISSKTLVKGLFDGAVSSAGEIERPQEDKGIRKYEKLITDEHLDKASSKLTTPDGSKPNDLKEYNQILADDPHNAQALFERAILLEEAGDKQRAVEGFRLAAKIFLEEGDIASYQSSRDRSNQLLEIEKETDEQEIADREFELVVDGLFG